MTTYATKVLVDLSGSRRAEWCRQPAVVHAAEECRLLKG